MTYNLYTQLRGLLIRGRLEVGTVTAISGGDALVQLPGGAVKMVRGSADVGSQVYIRDGLIEGLAPGLPVVEVLI